MDSKDRPCKKTVAASRRKAPKPTPRRVKVRAVDKAKGLIACGALTALVAAGGALAYLTASDTATTEFSLNTDMAISLSEPAWKAEGAMNLAPTQTVAKDPRIANEGSIPIYAMAQVKVPVFTGNVADDAGGSQPVADADLFSYAVNAGWNRTGSPQLEEGFRTYTYVYDDAVQPQGSTVPVFDEVTLANLAAPTDLSSASITVTGFGIQTLGFTGPEAAWAAYCAQNIGAVTA